MRKSSDPLLMKINKHKSSHQDPKQLFSPSSKNDSSSISQGNIGTSHKIKSPTSRPAAKKLDLDRSTKRSSIMMSDGRIKSSISLDKVSVKSSSNYEKLSPVSKKKGHKRTEDVDLQKMLIEQYQQSNALLAQNINTLLMLNQQAAANQISTTVKPTLDNKLKAPTFTALLGKNTPVSSNVISKLNTSVSNAPLSKQIIEQARNKVKSSTSRHVIPTTRIITTKLSSSNNTYKKPINGVTTVATSNVLTLKTTIVNCDKKNLQNQVKGNLQSQLSLNPEKSIFNKSHLSLQNQVKGNLQSQLSLNKDKSSMNKSNLSETQTQVNVTKTQLPTNVTKTQLPTNVTKTQLPTKKDPGKSHFSGNQEKVNISRSQSQNPDNRSQLPSKTNSVKSDSSIITKEQGLGDITEYLRQQSKSKSPGAPISSQSRGNSKMFLSSKIPTSSAGKQTSPATVKLSSSSQPSPSAATIMKNILNAKLPKTPPVNDPRLSAERIRKNSLSNLSDSGDSIFSSSGNFADSFLDDSFIKARRLSVGSDKSDISDKSNELKSGKSPLKLDAPRLSLSEYQQRRKEIVKPTTTTNTTINVRFSTQSENVNQNNLPNVSSATSPHPVEKGNLITGFSFSESSKAPIPTEKNDDKIITQSKFSSIRKYADDDFFIPRKASNFLNRDLPEPISQDEVSEKEIVKQSVNSSAGFSDGGGREIKKVPCENAESDTSSYVQKRRKVKMNTDTESLSPSKVRVDDDIEFEYQAFLKSIGVKLKSRKTLAKCNLIEKQDDDGKILAPPDVGDPVNVEKNDCMESLLTPAIKQMDEISVSGVDQKLSMSPGQFVSHSNTSVTSSKPHPVPTQIEKCTPSTGPNETITQLENKNQTTEENPTEATVERLVNVINSTIMTSTSSSSDVISSSSSSHIEINKSKSVPDTPNNMRLKDTSKNKDDGTTEMYLKLFLEHPPVPKTAISVLNINNKRSTLRTHTGVKNSTTSSDKCKKIEGKDSLPSHHESSVHQLKILEDVTAPTSTLKGTNINITVQENHDSFDASSTNQLKVISPGISEPVVCSQNEEKCESRSGMPAIEELIDNDESSVDFSVQNDGPPRGEVFIWDSPRKSTLAHEKCHFKDSIRNDQSDKSSEHDASLSPPEPQQLCDEGEKSGRFSGNLDNETIDTIQSFPKSVGHNRSNLSKSASPISDRDNDDTQPCEMNVANVQLLQNELTSSINTISLNALNPSHNMISNICSDGGKQVLPRVSPVDDDQTNEDFFPNVKESTGKYDKVNVVSKLSVPAREGDVLCSKVEDKYVRENCSLPVCNKETPKNVETESDADDFVPPKTKSVQNNLNDSEPQCSKYTNIIERSCSIEYSKNTELESTDQNTSTDKEDGISIDDVEGKQLVSEPSVISCGIPSKLLLIESQDTNEVVESLATSVDFNNTNNIKSNSEFEPNCNANAEDAMENPSIPNTDEVTNVLVSMKNSRPVTLTETIKSTVEDFAEHFQFPEDSPAEPASHVSTDHVTSVSQDVEVKNIPANPDATSFIVPPGLSKLEQLASIAVSESQGPYTLAEPINNSLLSPTPRTSLIDLPFLMSPPLPPTPNNVNNTKTSSARKPKTSKKMRSPKNLQKRRNSRVKSKRLVSDDELSSETITESEISPVATVEPSPSTLDTTTDSLEMEGVVTDEASITPVSNKKSRKGKPRGSHSCDTCGKHFTLARLLNSHVKRDHSEGNVEETHPKNILSDNVEPAPILPVSEECLLKEKEEKNLVANENDEKVGAKSLKKAKNNSKISGKVKVERGRKTRASKSSMIGEEIKDEKDEKVDVKVEVDNVKTDSVEAEKRFGVISDEKILGDFDDKSDVKLTEETMDEKTSIERDIGDEQSSKKRRTSKTPEDSRKSRTKRKNSVEKTDSLISLIDNSDASSSLLSGDTVLMKSAKSKKSAKGESKKDIDKQKALDSEESSGIANSIRTKIQKLLACSELCSDTLSEQTFGSPPSHPEGIGKRQPKATLKKKAFMEELHSQKSRRKRVKPQVNPIPQIMEMVGDGAETLLNPTLNDDQETKEDLDEEVNIQSKSNSLISMMSVGREIPQEVTETDIVPDEMPPSKSTIATVADIDEASPCQPTLDNMVKPVITSTPTKRKYKCKICSSEFWKVQQLNEHTLKHSQRTYDCYKCDEKFTTMRALTKHLLVHEDVRYASTERPHDCETCGYKCETENQLIVHKKTHKVNACTLCSTKCHSITELYNHIGKCHPEGMQQVLRCAHCNESFDNLSEFRKHLIQVHEMNTKQAAVACKNKGIIPDDFKKAEEEKKRILEEKHRMSEEKKKAKGLLLKNRVLKMDKGNEKNTIPNKKGVVRKAKEVIERSRKVKMNLRRDAASLKASANSVTPDTVPTTSSTLDSEITTLSESVIESTNVTDRNDDGNVDSTSIQSIKTSVSVDKESTAENISGGSTNEKAEVITPQRKLRSHWKSGHLDDSQNRENNKTDEQVGIDDPGNTNTEEVKGDPHTQKTRLPIGTLENIFNRVETSQKDETVLSIDPPPAKPISRQNSKEELKSPKHTKEDMKLNIKSVNDKKKDNSKDELKISIKSPTHDRRSPLQATSPLQDLSKKSDDSEKVLSEEDQKQLKLKVECAERTARMLIRNQRRTSDSPQNKRIRKSSERNETSHMESPGVERIEPVKIKVQVKMNEFDRETTAFVLTSPDLSDNNETEATKKSNKRKGKRKSVRGNPKDTVNGSHKSRKRCKVSPNNENIDEMSESTHKELGSPFDGNVSLSESQLGESDEIPCLLPGGIDFDKEYDYKNQMKEKSFLTEDDLMSSLMTLADCAVDAHMIEMKDTFHRNNDGECNYTCKVDDLQKVCPTKDDVNEDVKAKVDDVTASANKPNVDVKRGLDLKVSCDSFDTPGEDCSQLLQPPSGEQGYCFTPTPTLDHDYFGNFDPESMNTVNHQIGKSDTHHPDQPGEAPDEKHFSSVDTQDVNKNVSSVDQSNELSIYCSNAFKNNINLKESLLRVCDITETGAVCTNYTNRVVEASRAKDESIGGEVKTRNSSSSNALITSLKDNQVMGTEKTRSNIDFVSEQMGSMKANQGNGNENGTKRSAKTSGGSCSTPLKDNEARKNVSAPSAEKSDNSIFLALDESCNLSTPISTEIIKRHGFDKDRKRCLVSEDSFDDENWSVPESTPRNTSDNRYGCTNVVIKTEDDTYDIDVQASDLNDISIPEPPYEEINNNFNETEENIPGNSVKFYSCDNNVRNNDGIDYIESEPSSHSNTDNKLDTDFIVSLSPTIINKTVSDLIAQSGGTFYCRYCRRKYRKESSVKQHALTHINSIKHPFKCIHCPSSFRKCSEYINHKSVHSSLEEKVNTNTKELLPENRLSENNETKSSRTERVCSTETCHYPKPAISKAGSKLDKICCKYCPMNFTDESSYKLHLRNNHKIWHKIGGKDKLAKHTCFKCGLEFSSRKTLIRHDKFVHSLQTDGNRCLICGRMFLKKIYLKSHTRTHQGLYPFRCLECHRVYNKQCQLYNHVKSHQKV